MVWLSPPCGPYSPLHNANARNDRQRAELQEKRREALKIYIGACVIVHYCVQRGTHVAVELAERCLAWRLPVFQKLQSRYQMQAVITKGCRVGLRGTADRPLMQKGWRVLTTHSRLAQTLDRPCKCPRSYQHDKCEGSRATKSELYTKEFARRAVRAALQELDHVTSRECQGQSQLHGAFGVGHCCTCQEVSLPQRTQKCGWRLGSSQSDRAEDSEVEASDGRHQELEASRPWLASIRLKTLSVRRVCKGFWRRFGI